MIGEPPFGKNDISAFRAWSGRSVAFLFRFILSLTQACKKWNVFSSSPPSFHAFAILQLLFLPSGFGLQDISPPCILKPTFVGPALGMPDCFGPLKAFF